MNHQNNLFKVRRDWIRKNKVTRQIFELNYFYFLTYYRRMSFVKGAPYYSYFGYNRYNVTFQEYLYRETMYGKMMDLIYEVKCWEKEVFE